MWLHDLQIGARHPRWQTQKPGLFSHVVRSGQGKR